MTPTIAAGEASERRRRPRLLLAYPVRLFGTRYGSRVETKTENISCEGFFCITESFFSPREKLDCELVLTNGDGWPADDAIILRCRAEVVRVVQRNENSTFGVGCRVADYTVEYQFSEQALALDHSSPEPVKPVDPRHGDELCPTAVGKLKGISSTTSTSTVTPSNVAG